MYLWHYMMVWGNKNKVWLILPFSGPRIKPKQSPTTTSLQCQAHSHSCIKSFRACLRLVQAEQTPRQSSGGSAFSAGRLAESSALWIISHTPPWWQTPRYRRLWLACMKPVHGCVCGWSKVNVPLCVFACQDPKDAVADELGESAGGV